MTVRPTAITGCALALALGAAGCANSRPTAHAPSAVAIQGFAYKPTSVTVARGTKLRFDNRDAVEHTATADDGTAFDSGPIQPHRAAVITLTRTGRFAYHCDFHPFMRATITVK